MSNGRLTMAQALVRHLCAQHVDLDGAPVPLFGGVFTIFGHGNVTCLGEALAAERGSLPVHRGQNEQSMALAAVAYAKAHARRRIMACAASIGPGATNMVTAAAVAHADRLPVLLLAGDTFASRLPDPVLQQVEHFGAPSTTVNDAFRAVVRYWDRIVRPEQIVQSLPQAIATMLDPAECGPAFLGLAQDAQGEAFDYPASFFAPVIHRIRRPRPDRAELAAAAAAILRARRPLIVAGGGVHHSRAVAELADFAQKHGIPVVETIAGRGCLVHDHPANAGPLGINGSSSANALAGEADLVIAIGTRLQDVITGSWTVFGHDDLTLVAVNTARVDAIKHGALSVVGDARETLAELDLALGSWCAPVAWSERARLAYGQWNLTLDQVGADRGEQPPSYAQVVAAVNRSAGPHDRVVTAAGGLVGELNKGWRVKAPGTVDCEFGYSCMGYEIAGGLGARMALAAGEGEVIVLVGDGSYLMLNGELLSSVTNGYKLVVVLCDNRGFAIIDRLQTAMGGRSFNNMLASSGAVRDVPVDFVAHARSMGARAEQVGTVVELSAALDRARAADRTSVMVIRTDPSTWTTGDAWWDLGMPELSSSESVRAASARHAEQRRRRRIGR